MKNTHARSQGTEAVAKGSAQRAPKKKSTVRKLLVPVALILIGLSVMLYPVVSSAWNNHAQKRVAAEYEDLMGKTDPAKLNAAIERAREFNRQHTPGPILDPWDSRVSKDNELYQLYLSQLAGQPAMSQVIIPSIDSQLPVYHGTKDETLQRGLGHLYGSALPIGGESTHSIITGHTGITNATLWDNLDKVRVGDAVYVSTFGLRMKYEVHDIEVVLPNETESLKPVGNQDLLTLITCTPYGVNTHRLLVHAHRVPMDPADEGEFDRNGFAMQWWMWAVLALAALVLGLLAWWISKTIKRDRHRQ